MKYVRYHGVNPHTGEPTWGPPKWLDVAAVLPVNAWVSIYYGTCADDADMDLAFVSRLYDTKEEFDRAVVAEIPANMPALAD